jgi:hypothetical protein
VRYRDWRGGAGQALGVGEGPLVVGAFAGFGVGGGERLAVFGSFKFEFF